MPRAVPTHKPNRGTLPEHVPRSRESAAKRGYDRAHGRWREAVLNGERCQGVCEACKNAAATVADHIKPLKQGGGWSLRNGQGLCQACHNRKTARERTNP